MSSEAVMLCPLDEISNRSIIETTQATEEDLFFSVQVDGQPGACNLIRVQSGPILKQLRAARANGKIRFREVRQASLGSKKRDVTPFTEVSSSRGTLRAKHTIEQLIERGDLILGVSHKGPAGP